LRRHASGAHRDAVAACSPLNNAQHTHTVLWSGNFTPYVYICKISVVEFKIHDRRSRANLVGFLRCCAHAVLTHASCGIRTIVNTHVVLTTNRYLHSYSTPRTVQLQDTCRRLYVASHAHHSLMSLTLCCWPAGVLSWSHMRIGSW
jgi:hypothetical protein